MIKYLPKQDRRTFFEKNAFFIFALIGLAAAAAFNDFHNRTKRTDVIKNPNQAILKTVSDIRKTH